MPTDLTAFTFPIRGEKLSQTVEVRDVIFRGQSPYQSIEIFDTEIFGRMLLLDGHIQLTEFDEKAYHEGLVQIPLMNLDRPSRALVVGGGDGGVIRELCRSASMTHIDMVEIDQLVVDTCRQHLPSLSAGAFDDPRVHLHIADAFPFVKQDLKPYDLIVVDSTDTYEDEEGEISEMLFTKEFYQDLARLLQPQGLLVTQADNLVFCPYSLEDIKGLFGQVFPVVESYQALVPSFGGFSGYCTASHGRKLDPKAAIPAGMQYLNPVTYSLAFQPLSF
ncbi:MAG: hypothetical protein JNJ45_00530 [Chthonomonas sp.]|nr:hypothetical protein [Chthonomonas sp.]